VEVSVKKGYDAKGRDYEEVYTGGAIDLYE
jgi:hypothetical protein